MSKRSSIRLPTKVIPREEEKYNPSLLYCNHTNCPLNSLYQCTYCKSHTCIKHVKIIDEHTCVCLNCILENETLYNIYGAMEMNNNKESKFMIYLRYICSMQWIYCNNRIEPY
jgi:hypothetical protein